jgi:hypothetical protein
MRVSEEFGKFFRAEDVQAPVVRTIAGATIEMLGEEQEKNLVVAFSDDGRRLVAKPTRRSQLVELFGDDTDLWAGRQVELYTAMVPFAGKRVPSIQVRAPKLVDAAG